jgi:hypothetical protein
MARPASAVAGVVPRLTAVVWHRTSSCGTGCGRRSAVCRGQARRRWAGTLWGLREAIEQGQIPHWCGCPRGLRPGRATRWGPAAEDYRALAQGLSGELVWPELALVQVAGGDEAGYRKTRAEGAELAGGAVADGCGSTGGRAGVVSATGGGG